MNTPLICSRGEDCKCKTQSIRCGNSRYEEPNQQDQHWPFTAERADDTAATFPTTHEIAARERTEGMSRMQQIHPIIQSYHPSELPERVKISIDTAKMDPKHDYLNALMDPGPVQRPSHYDRFVIEPITFAVANKLNALEAKVVKYTVRAPYKNGKDDLLKARRCIDMLIEKMARDERIAAGEDPKNVWKDAL